MIKLVKPPHFEYGPLCLGCKHFQSRKLACPAFPNGIPSDVLEGFLPHVEVLPGQKGAYVFEPKEKIPELTRRGEEQRIRFPKEWVEKWITYRGRRIPIIKKEYRDEWYKSTRAIYAGLALGGVVGAGVIHRVLFKREAGRLARLLTEKGAKWVLPSNPLWLKVVQEMKTSKTTNPVLNWLCQHTGKYMDLKGKLTLPQVRRTRLALSTLESRLPGLLRDVHLVNYKMPRLPLIGGLTASNTLKAEAGRVAKSDHVWESYEKVLLSQLTKAGADKDAAEMLVVSAGGMHRVNLLELGKTPLKIGKTLFVAFPSSRILGTVYPSRRLVYHEFGHVLQAKHDNLEKFLIDVYAPYVERVLTPVTRLTERLTALTETEGFKDLFRELLKVLRFTREARQRLLTPYSMTNPVEGYAEAFSFYMHKPSLLKKKWPEAYAYFRDLEKAWGKGL